MAHEHRFLLTRDGVRIAYAEHGTGPPLVYVRGWLSHLDALWEQRSFREFIEVLAGHFRVIRYDVRGNGLSQRDGFPISHGALVTELEDVVDHLGLDRFVLYGASFGGPITMTYTARHADRVAALILDGTYARGSRITTVGRRWLLVMALRYFPEMAFLLLSNATHPSPGRTSQQTLEMGERMVSPKVGARLYALAFSTDVHGVLHRIRTPTLILHRTRSRSIPVRLGRELAQDIQDARFVALNGEEHNSWEGDSTETLAAIAAFLDVRLDAEPRPPTPSPTGPGTPFVFVSYAHEDAVQVNPVIEHLERCGIRVWRDAGIQPGAEWRDQIAGAVQRCSVLLFFASDRSVSSRHCLAEVYFAMDERKPIVVVQLHALVLPPPLRMALGPTQALMKFNVDPAAFEHELVEALARPLRQTPAN